MKVSGAQFSIRVYSQVKGKKEKGKSKERVFTFAFFLLPFYFLLGRCRIATRDRRQDRLERLNDRLFELRLLVIV